MKKLILKHRSLRISTLTILIVFEVMFSMTTFAAENTEFTIQLPESVHIGNSFEIIISAKRNTDIKAISMNIKYDENYISYKSSKNIQRCEINTYNKKGKLAVILLFDDTLNIGEFVSFTFTAKSGIDSSTQNIIFEVDEAVSASLNNVSIEIPSSVKIKTEKKSEKYSDSDKTSKQKISANSKTSSSSVNSKDYYAKTNSSKINSLRSDISSKTNGSSIKSYSSKSGSNVSENNNISMNKNNTGNKDTTTSISPFGDYQKIDSLELNNDEKGKYIFVGIGGTISVMGILFAAYRLGQLSKKKNEADKIFPPNEKDDKW